jgi:hypothetical protein
MVNLIYLAFLILDFKYPHDVIKIGKAKMTRAISAAIMYVFMMFDFYMSYDMKKDMINNKLRYKGGQVISQKHYMA